MSRLTRQEQLAVWILLVLITGGALGRHLIRHREPPSQPATIR